MTVPGRILDHIPAAISLRIRAEPAIRALVGKSAPAEFVQRLVPPGRNAVDVGANRGIYSYWMAKRAVIVDAFEPQPALAAYIRSARLRNVCVHEVALSDHVGTAQLLVPQDDGLARIASTSADDPVAIAAEAEIGPKRELGVSMRTLDSYGLSDVGFVKIDAEGHELAVLLGASDTIVRNRPVVFIESEARHAAGAPGNVIALMLERFGYRRGAFVRAWLEYDIENFDLQRDQLDHLPDFMSADYVSNFVFWP